MKNRLCNNIKDEGGFSYAFSASIFVFVFVRRVRFFWVNIQGEFLMPNFWVILNFSAKGRERKGKSVLYLNIIMSECSL